MNKRSFIKNVGVMSAAISVGFVRLQQAVAAVEHVPAAALAANEEVWRKVRDDYRIKPDYINLENGYYCFLPEQTLEDLIDHMRAVNYEGSYYMRTVQFDNKKKVADSVAAIVAALLKKLLLPAIPLNHWIW